MKKLLAFGLLAFITLALPKYGSAQDTTRVQTLTFDDGIHHLRQTYKFPSKNQTFRKVLAFMTLKCDKGLISNPTGSGCGEWDAGADLKIYHHTGEYDSTYKVLGKYLINGSYPKEFDYLEGPLFNYYEHYEKNRSITKVNSENETVFDADNDPMTLAETAGQGNIFLWRADELKAAGFSTEEFEQIGFSMDQASSFKVRLRISYKNAAATAVNQMTTDGFTEVYTSESTLAASGYQNFVLNSPIKWDGTSSLAIRLEVLETEKPVTITGETTSFNATAAIGDRDGYLELDGNEYVVAKMNDYQFEDEITVAFWANGNPDDLPAPTTIFSCTDNLGRKVASGHVAWNSNVRWDSGSKGNNDRCQKEGSTAQIEGKWHHWAFTKNVKTGITRIYLDGKRFHQENSDFLPIGRINRLLLGSNVGYTAKNGYFGKIDDFTMWKKELTESVINNWMHQDIDESHPNKDDLVLYYTFNEAFAITDHSGNGFSGMSTSPAVHLQLSAEDAFKDLLGKKQRANIKFIRGDYEYKTDSILVRDSLLAAAAQLIEYGTDGRKFVVKQVKNIWEPQKTHTYDYLGNVKETIDHSATSKISKDSVEYYEGPIEVTYPWTIAKYITPYGNNLNLGDGFTWVWDVTEFQQYLKDSVDLEAGSTRELINLEFMMVEGPAPAPLKITRLWENEASKYWMLDQDSTKKPIDVKIDPSTQHLFLQSSVGGHGHASENGEYPHCCEWKNNEHFMYANGKQVDVWRIWKNCGTTALFPQGGTWPGARAGWCPGDIRDLHYTRLTQYVRSDNSINLDYRITPVPADNAKMGNGGYSNGGWYLMEYGKPTFEHDAEVLTIINPSDWDIYKRLNPICDNASVIIRNNGEQALTELTFTYGVRGGEDLTYQWKGNLFFKEVDTVSLPVTNGSFYEGDGSQTFVVTVSKPNGKDDEYKLNDSHTSHYELPDMFDTRIKILLQTNNYPQHNSYYVTNALGYKIFERTNMDANTKYEDEMNTYGGCYTLHFFDTGNDGLSYWANPPQGSGSLSIRQADNNKMLKSFNSDCGSGLQYSFAMGSMTYIKEPNLEEMMQVYPNPASSRVYINLSGSTQNTEIQLFNSVGQSVYSKTLGSNELEVTIEVSHLKPGIYTAKWLFDGNTFTRKVMLVR